MIASLGYVKYSIPVVSFEETPYDPRYTFFGLTAFYLSNPLIGLLAAALIGALTSYYFYRISLNSKRIYLEKEDDRLVVNTDKTTPPLLYDLEKNPVHCASLCTLAIKRVGTGHIQSQDVISPLVIILKGVAKIISFQISDKKGSWTIPEENKVGDEQLKINFVSLVAGDYAIILILCKQDEPISIQASLGGDIKDTTIRTRQYRIRGIRMGDIVPFGLGMIFAIPPTMISLALVYYFDLEGYQEIAAYGIMYLITLGAMLTVRDFLAHAVNRILRFVSFAR